MVLYYNLYRFVILITCFFIEDSRRELVENGTVERLLSFLDSRNKDLLQASCGALLNIAGDDDARRIIKENGGIEQFLAILSQYDVKDSRYRKLYEYAAGALLNVTVETDQEVYDIVKAQHGVDTLYPLLSSPNIEMQRCTVGSLGLLCVDPEIAYQLMDKGFDPITKLLEAEDSDLLARAIAAVWNLSVATDELRVALNRAGALDKCVDIIEPCIEKGDPEVLSNLAMAITIMSINEDNASRVRELGGLEKIALLLQNDDEHVQSTAAAAVWNLCSDPQNTQVFYELKVLQYLIPLLDLHDNVDAVEKALGAIINLCKTEDCRVQFREMDGFSKLEPLLTVMAEEDKQLLYTLACFGVLSYNNENNDSIRDCGALAKIIEYLNDDYKESILEKSTGAMTNLSLNVCLFFFSCFHGANIFCVGRKQGRCSSTRWYCTFDSVVVPSQYDCTAKCCWCTLEFVHQ